MSGRLPFPKMKRTLESRDSRPGGLLEWVVYKKVGWLDRYENGIG